MICIKLTNVQSSIYNDDSGNAAENLDNSILPTRAKLTLTVEEMAQQLNVSRATAYNLAKRKEFYPAFRIGERLIISTHALVRWLDEQTEG